MSLPFAGYSVLDLTNVIAGPYCGYHLALMGAEVLKVENPGGDLARRLGADPALNARNMGASFLALSAGKRSMTLNLKHAQGVEVFKKLVATADVVLENFRPGVMARLGLGYPVLRELRPGLIYCAITGFGQETSYRDKPAYDQIVQGLSGAMATTGTPESGPLRVGYPISDTVAGMNAAYGIAAALLTRERTGEGQLVDVSMLDSVLSIMGWANSNLLVAGQEPVLMGNDNYTASPSGSFRTADGLINIAANMPHQFETLCRALERLELIKDERFIDPEARLVNREALKGELERTLAGQPTGHWVDLLNEAGVPAGPVLTIGQAVDLPPVRERGTVREITDIPGLPGPVRVLTGGYQLSGGAPQMGPRPPELGEHTGEVLESLGYSQAEREAMVAGGVV